MHVIWKAMIMSRRALERTKFISSRLNQKEIKARFLVISQESCRHSSTSVVLKQRGQIVFTFTSTCQ